MSLNLDTVASELGIRKGKSSDNEQNYYCPVHDNSTPDMYVTNGEKFYCHPSGEGGKSPVTLVMHTQEMSKDEAVEWLSESFPDEFGNMDKTTIKKRNNVREVLTFAAEEAHEFLVERRQQQAADIKENRALDDEDLENYMIGFMHEEVNEALKDEFSREDLIDSGLYGEDKESGDLYNLLSNRVTFPYINHGQVTFMAGRSTDESFGDAKYKKIYNTEYNNHGLYMFKGNGNDKVVITEGFTDAISADKAGVDTVSPATVQFKDDDVQKVVDQVSGYSKIFVVNDGDEAGQEGAMKTADILTGNENEPVIVELEEGMDFDDWTTENGYGVTDLLEGGEYYLDNLIDTVKNGDRHSRPEAKQTIFELVSDWSSTKRNELFRDLPDNLEKIQEEFEEATQGSGSSHSVSSVSQGSTGGQGEGDRTDLPDDHDPGQEYFSESGGFRSNKLAEDIESDYHFIYSMLEEKLYVYENGVYEDAERTVKEEANQRLGDYFKKTRVSDTIEAIETRPGVAKTQEEMQPPKNLINFENGVFNVYSGELEEHRPEYLFTQQIPHSYNEELLMEDGEGEIEKFIDEITGGVEDKETLVEMSGYTMMTDMPIAASFMLIGQGQNGKTVFLNMLRNLIGSDNIKDEELQQLEGGRFATRHLYRKLMVVCDDLPSEELSEGGTLKALTGGSSVRAEIKGGDSFEFENYASPVFAANQVPKTGDQSDGFFRRWHLIDFPYKFVENPSPRNSTQKQAEPKMKLRQRLHDDEELSRFATKAAQAISDVMNRGEFTHQEHPDETRTRWNSYADPTLEFLNKYVSRGINQSEAEERSRDNVQDQMSYSQFDFDYIVKDVLHQAIKAYNEGRSSRPPTKADLTRRINKDTELYPKNTRSRQPDYSDGLVQIYGGVRFNENFRELLEKCDCIEDLERELGVQSTNNQLPEQFEEMVEEHESSDDKQSMEEVFNSLKDSDGQVEIEELFEAFDDERSDWVEEKIEENLNKGVWMEPQPGTVQRL